MRSKVLWLAVLSSVLLTGFVFAQSTTVVAGRESSLAGRKLKLQSFNQQIFIHPVTLDTTTADSTGAFLFRFNISGVRSAELNLGSFTLQFFVDPGDSLFLHLPEYSPLTRSQLYDPYFKPDVYLYVPDGEKSGPLNEKILTFETWYDSVYQASMKSVVVYHNDSVVADTWLKNFGSMPKHSFMDRYKWFSSASLYRMAYPYAKDSLIKLYFRGSGPDLYNPAFWSAFNATFKSAIIEEGNNTIFKNMVDPVWKGDYIGLRRAINLFYRLEDDAMSDLVTLKGVYEVWFLFPDLHPMLEKLLNNGLGYIQDSKIRTMATVMLQELTALLPGKPVPEFTLQDVYGGSVNLSRPGNYVLLGFVSPELLQCRKDFMVQDEKAELFGDHLTMVNVVLYQPKKDFQEFMKSYQGKIRFVYPDQTEKLVTGFNVKGLPVYYLISPTGTIIAVPQHGGLVQMFEKLETLYK
ncbi:TlpA family protein disulfide reductase [Saccharicrinis sp. FJH2]|uniref:TlpA family protein disulfide reductase n=1 Tax=Saccharicrinis sp. FJH65 TaxID=3344659 RepID=UPI0035F4EE48